MRTQIFLLILSALGCGCAAHPPRPDAPLSSAGAGPTAGSADDESLEISYALGHSHRRVRMEAHELQVLAQGWVEHNQLKKGAIPLARFHEYFSQVAAFVDKTRSLASSQTGQTAQTVQTGQAGQPLDGDCRTPYTITLHQNGTPPRTLSGCRQENDSNFNQLVNRGEFLLFSSK